MESRPGVLLTGAAPTCPRVICVHGHSAKLAEETGIECACHPAADTVGALRLHPIMRSFLCTGVQTCSLLVNPAASLLKTGSPSCRLVPAAPHPPRRHPVRPAISQHLWGFTLKSPKLTLSPCMGSGPQGIVK